MFKEVIQRLHESMSSKDLKERVLVEGREVFDHVLRSAGITTGEQAIQIAIDEFSRKFPENPEAIKLFKLTLQKELTGIRGARLVKSKIKVLRKSWEIENQTILQDQRRKRVVTLRLTEEEYKQLVTQAREEGTTLSGYIRKKLGLNK
ncbi:hypothetical protein [Thermococcus sp. 9N3]|uniref:plasmid mobilization protein n=1 Tax=Thermococcus sp. 9N3 TaxID=163002 RepID=UPI001430DB93|nr:hypothetical protein [Thermococcus sp. 9N3]NJE50064.1 hypothetical protein [Thermococcus sp. 9N3]